LNTSVLAQFPSYFPRWRFGVHLPHEARHGEIDEDVDPHEDPVQANLQFPAFISYALPLWICLAPLNKFSDGCLHRLKIHRFNL
jgi:hypothetical protein